MNINDLNPTLRLLLTTTEKLIEEKGCNQTTMQNIIRDSGISKGGIYHYVESKDELLSMVLRFRMEQNKQEFLQLLEESKQNRNDLVQMLFDHLNFAQQMNGQILFYLLSKNEDLSVRQTIRSYYRYCVQIMTDWISYGQQIGEFSSQIDIRKMADLFTLISLGFYVRSMIPSESGFFSKEDFLKLVKGIIIKDK